VGLLNLVVMAEHTAEDAVLVADPWQGQGVATRLVSAVFRSPPCAGWSIRALVQPDNAAARRVLGRVVLPDRDLSASDRASWSSWWTSRVEEDSDDGGGTGRRVL
jgi:GNAT superfamily N-acetyltransferase